MATATKKAPLVLEFAFAKDTKGTVVFKEVDPPNGERPAVGSLYLTKAAGVKLGVGKKIRVTIETVD